MLRMARERFPDADLRRGDAADLDGLPPGGFDLVVLSYNGLDVLDHQRRLGAMRAMARCLSPDGRLVFSSFNLDGHSFDERPWRLWGGTPERTRTLVKDHLRHPTRLPRGLRYYLRTKRASQDGPGWARRPMRAHEFRFVVHFATLASTVEMLREAGLLVVSAFGEDGRVLHVEAGCTDADYVQYVCRLDPQRSGGLGAG